MKYPLPALIAPLLATLVLAALPAQSQTLLGVKVEPATTLVQLERSVAAKIGHADAAASPAVVRAFLAGAASVRKDADDDVWGQLHREQLKKIAATRQADATSTEKTW